jgi:hypothetical protein
MTDESVAAEEPLELRWLRAHGLHFLTPWHFVEVALPEAADGFRTEFQRETMEGSLPSETSCPSPSARTRMMSRGSLLKTEL